MIDQDFQIVGLDKGALRCVAEEIVRMANDELIQRRRRSHQHGAGTPASSSRAAGALPRSGDGAGISGHHYNIEGADVNAEFQRAGRNHAADFPVAQAALDFASFVGQIATAIAANGIRLARQLRICLLQIGQKDFRVQPRIGEDHGLQITLQKFLCDARGFIDVTAADS